MIDYIFNAIYYAVPWWVWLFIGLTIALLVYRIWGLKAALAAATAALLATTYRRGQQTGWRDRQRKEENDAERSINRAGAARLDADKRNADPGRLRDNDGFRRD